MLVGEPARGPGNRIFVAAQAEARAYPLAGSWASGSVIFEEAAFLDGLWWLLLLVGPLLFLQRRLHYETQAMLLLLTRQREIAVVLFSLLFLPGVLLHEGSHFVMARLLGVRTGRFSILPRTTAQGRLQLGYVETASTDIVRDALIGAAPLLAGGSFVGYAGLSRLGFLGLWSALEGLDLANVGDAMVALPGQPDFWIWFYLVFAVSSTMLPSPSDRRAWLPLTLTGVLALVVSLLAGAGPWMLVHLAPLVNGGLRSVALVLAITVAVHLAVLPPFWVMRRGLSWLTGMEVG